MFICSVVAMRFLCYLYKNLSYDSINKNFRRISEKSKKYGESINKALKFMEIEKKIPLLDLIERIKNYIILNF